MLKLSYRENNRNTADLYLQEGRTRRVSPLAPSMICITRREDPEFGRVAAFIRKIYRRSYGAKIEVGYPALMSVRNTAGDILAAVGFRYAAEEPLFLEQYTGAPLEEILSCPRRQIAEIGNLASAGKGASVFLFAALASYLDNKNIRFAAITGTDFLHRYFERNGLKPRRICDADIASVRDGGQDWGSYYDNSPRVLAGSVGTGVRCLKATLGAEFEKLSWTRDLRAGRTDPSTLFLQEPKFHVRYN